jgi:hypothetical protein
MSVTAARARALALSLPGTTTYPHFDRLAFRLPRRTFATLGLDSGDMNLMFDHEHQEKFCERAPQAIAPVAGGWGRMGWTRCDLKQIDGATLKAALEAAHALASVPRTGRGSSAKAASSQPTATKPAPPAKTPSKRRSGKPAVPKNAPSKKAAPKTASKAPSNLVSIKRSPGLQRPKKTT